MTNVLKLPFVLSCSNAVKAEHNLTDGQDVKCAAGH